MKFIIGILLLCATGYLTYSYATSDTPKVDTDVTPPGFEGTWDLTLTPNKGAECGKSTAEVSITDDKILGTLTLQDGSFVSFNANIDSKGNMQNNTSRILLTFDGLIDGGVGRGTWSDKYGCAGNFTLYKIEKNYDTTDLSIPKSPSRGGEYGQDKE